MASISDHYKRYFIIQKLVGKQKQTIFIKRWFDITTEGFFSNLDILYGGLGIGKL
jgi:hypothetical protein